MLRRRVSSRTSGLVLKANDQVRFVRCSRSPNSVVVICIERLGILDGDIKTRVPALRRRLGSTMT